MALTEALNNRRSERILKLEAEKKRFQKNEDKKQITKDANSPSRLRSQNPRKRHVSGDSMVTINSNMSSPFANGNL